jgi:hypothetical protein
MRGKEILASYILAVFFPPFFIVDSSLTVSTRLLALTEILFHSKPFPAFSVSRARCYSQMEEEKKEKYF